MLLYTCPARTIGGSAPIVQHPCGLAAKALDDAGHVYDVKALGGFKSLPLSRRGRRDEVIELTGRPDVPVLLLDDGTAVGGSLEIVAWAESNPALSSPPTGR